jgi:hypothetical protein
MHRQQGNVTIGGPLNINKPLIIAGAAATLGLAGLGAAHVASAASNPSGPDNGLVAKIADKFHLNKSDVQAVFDENRAEHQAAHQQRIEDRLNQAVKDGKLTEDQKNKILTKLAEVRATMESLKDKTPAERRATMIKQRGELEQWARDNNIPMQYLHPGIGMRGHHMMGGDVENN